MKATATAPASIALTKYWGRKDETLRLPTNGSIAVNLDHLTTVTTVEFSDAYDTDTVVIDGTSLSADSQRVIAHLDRVRSLAGITQRARVASVNSFPAKTGLSSSSSGFGALTLAATTAAGLTLSLRELSILARQGSGSACRSIADGFVEWHDAETSEESFAESIYAPDHWDIRDVVAIVSSGEKEVSTSEGHTTASVNPFMPVRIARMREKNATLKRIIGERDFAAFGALVEQEALELHAMMFTSGLFYLQPGTTEIIRLLLYRWRPQGLRAYFTINTGQDVHLFCEPSDLQQLESALSGIPSLRRTIVNRPGEGARISGEHLF